MNEVKKKTNYFYIDESGIIKDNSRVFIHGCIKTDSPLIVTNSIKELKKEIKESFYHQTHQMSIENPEKKFNNTGFHAVDNSFDIRADFYKILPYLNFRSYFVTLNKHTDFFKKLEKKGKEHEYFAFSLNKLIKDRIIKNKNDKNIFYFEEISLPKKSLKSILSEIFATLPSIYDSEFKIVGKEEENMSVVDYLNYTFYQILNDEKRQPGMLSNFELIAPKIASINVAHSNVFLSRKKKSEYQINFSNLKKEFGGKSE